MGIIDNAKDALDATGEKVKRSFEDTKDRLDDKADEHEAESNVKKAEAERDATQVKNDYKEKLRD
jgi:hypothetical protein